MSMEAQPSQDGRTRISLGTVEKWMVGSFGAGILLGCIWLVTSVQSMLAQQQVTSEQISGLRQQLQVMNTQLADVPALKIEMAKIAIQTEQNKQDIRELKQLRGIK
ncbi:hypothetical protein BCL79_0607 [Stenotrophomonas rhizophila]|uniref:Uncharacterized protein n=1 Tax=Stenotrophomonas rhizophila TaxID=216778 RepID=A0A498CM48_9GAMM|nr:hypothetical protein [Stenotrophomonas rhizophila]RLK56224.1 hypothetical protein BCL79_0607 [Stenotrophomonas rhizophila]